MKSILKYDFPNVPYSFGLSISLTPSLVFIETVTRVNFIPVLHLLLSRYLVFHALQIKK